MSLKSKEKSVADTGAYEHLVALPYRFARRLPQAGPAGCEPEPHAGPGTSGRRYIKKRPQSAIPRQAASMAAKTSVIGRCGSKSVAQQRDQGTKKYAGPGPARTRTPGTARASRRR